MWPSETAAMVLGGWLCVSLLAAVSADPENKVYKKVGDEVVLKPDTNTGTITNIMWNHGPNIAMRWDGTEIDSYRQFKARGSLNISTGELTITGLTINDSGLYTPEINDVVKTAIDLVVISSVPTPAITKLCDHKSSMCTLSCDGSTKGAEPVTYNWTSDDKILGSSKTQQITKNSSLDIKKFTCELSNPVSTSRSTPFSNPFTDTPGWKMNISTGLTVFISLMIAVLLLVFIHRCKAGTWFFNKSSMPWEADFWRRNESSLRDATEFNGRTAQGKGEADAEETPMV